MTFIKGYKQMPEHTAKIRAANIGKKRTPEQKERIRRASHLPQITDEFRAKLSRSSRWKMATPEQVAQWRAEMSKRFTGTHYAGVKETHWKWRGGVSFEPYTPDWKLVREQILQRDNCQCKKCGSTEGLQVHHIDYNKKNNAPENLVTLCLVHHTVTNHRRSFWKSFWAGFVLHWYVSREITAS